MKWTAVDSAQHWLKVRSSTNRVYFIDWMQDEDFLAIGLLAVIPADPRESVMLVVPLKAGELPHLEADEIATSVIRDESLLRLWQKHREKLEQSFGLEPIVYRGCAIRS